MGACRRLEPRIGGSDNPSARLLISMAFSFHHSGRTTPSWRAKARLLGWFQHKAWMPTRVGKGRLSTDRSTLWPVVIGGLLSAFVRVHLRFQIFRRSIWTYPVMAAKVLNGIYRLSSKIRLSASSREVSRACSAMSRAKPARARRPISFRWMAASASSVAR